jgi:hypothetical protein
MNLDEFLNRFGLFYEGGFELIHADWPIYPTGHGARLALESFGNFQRGTKFTRIDDIDQCDLFVANLSQNTNDPLNYQHYHVAIWHEDLVALHQNGWISGMQFLTVYESALIYYERIKSDPSFWIDGKLTLPKPQREVFDDPDKLELQFVDEISISEVGFQELLDFSSPRRSPFHALLESHIFPLMEIGYYDTAVREGCLLVECKLRKITGTDLYGQTLINSFLKQWKESEGGNTSTSWKILRGELRTLFKFLRNHYVHNLVALNQDHTYAILAQISRVLNALDNVNWKI